MDEAIRFGIGDYARVNTKAASSPDKPHRLTQGVKHQVTYFYCSE